MYTLIPVSQWLFLLPLTKATPVSFIIKTLLTVAQHERAVKMALMAHLAGIYSRLFCHINKIPAGWPPAKSISSLLC